MSRNERIFIAAILAVVSLLTSLDLFTDRQEGVVWWHIVAEFTVVITALVGVFLLLKGSFKLKQKLAHEKEISAKYLADSDKWRTQSKKYLQGLSAAIDEQLSAWDLTTSEKEITFLLLKGFSSKEIADIRQTSEKTVRAQATSIYSKANLAGRSQLAAFFLEDLLMPDESK